MRTLLLDIETSPMIAFVWGLWKQNIALNQIQTPGSTLCWAAKWYGDRNIHFMSVHDNSKEEMLEEIHSLIEEADVVIHYYGSKFDMPTLYQEFLAIGLGPPSPVIQIDLLTTVRRRFRLPSNKLDYVARHLGITGKMKHKGMELWKECMAGNDKSWKVMKAYNIQDIKLLEEVYDRLLPWISNHPNHALFAEDEEMRCPNCGSTHLHKRGLSYTKTMTYHRFRCSDCGSWSRSRVNNLDVDKRRNVLVGVV